MKKLRLLAVTSQHFQLTQPNAAFPHWYRSITHYWFYFRKDGFSFKGNSLLIKTKKT